MGRVLPRLLWGSDLIVWIEKSTRLSRIDYRQEGYPPTTPKCITEKTTVRQERSKKKQFSDLLRKGNRAGCGTTRSISNGPQPAVGLRDDANGTARKDARHSDGAAKVGSRVGDGSFKGSEVTADNGESLQLSALVQQERGRGAKEKQQTLECHKSQTGASGCPISFWTDPIHSS